MQVQFYPTAAHDFDCKSGLNWQRDRGNRATEFYPLVAVGSHLSSGWLRSHAWESIDPNSLNSIYTSLSAVRPYARIDDRLQCHCLKLVLQRFAIDQATIWSGWIWGIGLNVSVHPNSGYPNSAQPNGVVNANAIGCKRIDGIVLPLTFDSWILMGLS